MNPIEITEKAIEMASKDEKLKKSIKDTVATTLMDITDCKDTFLTFSIDKGELSFSQGKPENIDFQFEISKGDYRDLITGKRAGLILMATKKLKMVEGSMTEIGKIGMPLLAVPKFEEKIAENGIS